MEVDSVFGAWIKARGVVKIVAALHALGPEYEVSPAAVYQWWRRDHEPRLAKIDGLVRIADGAISADDVLEHFFPADVGHA
jgi:hypothetical protein